MTFDSIREFERFQELHLMERAGAIKNLVHQHRMPLTVGGKKLLSKKKRQLAYVVDFKYWDCENGGTKYEDVKGFDTPVSMLKIAIIEAELGITVDIVR